MAFKVIRNENTFNVEIQGANKPSHFLGTLTALTGNSDTTLHIRNDARTTDNSDPQYEFYDVPHTQFNNSAGSAFSDRDTAITQLNILFAGGTISSQVNTSNFFHYDDNSALTGREFNSAKGPAFWGQSLKPGEELFFSNNISGVLVIGKFGGATSVVGQTAAATSNWDRRIALDGQRDVSADGNERFSSTEFQIGREMDGSGTNNFAMRYDRATNKLQFIDFSHNFEMIIGQATAAEDGNPITIFFQAMSDSDTFTGNVTLPAITQRKVDLILHAEHTAGDVDDDDYYGSSGVVEDAVFKMNKPLNKGEKLVFTPTATHGHQNIMFDYTGTAGSGTGETNNHLRSSASLSFVEHDNSPNAGFVGANVGFTHNEQSSRFGDTGRTLDQVEREMSIRYHTDNKIDLYDEAAEEILLTKDSDADGNPITLFVCGRADDSGTNKVLPLKGLNMEPVGTDMSPRCHHEAFTVGTSSNVSINSDQNQNKNRLYGDTNNNSGGIPRFADQNDRIQFGAKLRPGMESAFTGPASFLTTTSNKPRGNQLGVSTGVSTSGNDWSWRVAFSYSGLLKNDELIGNSITPADFIDLDRTDVGGSDAGDELLLDATDGSGSNAGGKITLEQNTSDLFEDLTGVDMRLRYEHSTNLMHLDAIQNGVRKRVATGNVNLGGDELLITNSGDDAKALGLGTPYFYGMEYAHTPTAHPQLYRNMNNPFLDFPTQNTTMKAETVIRHIDGIMPGYKIHWQLPTESGNSLDFFFGDWKTGNAASGLSGLSADPDKWNWGFQFDDANEKILTSGLKNMEFNRKHPFYNMIPDGVGADNEYWQRPDNENKKTNVSWRYHDNNTIDLYDEDIGIVIMNYIGTQDGNAFKFAWVSEHDMTNSFHPNYITSADPKVSKITEADGDLPNGVVSQILRGKSPLLGANYYTAYGPNAGTRTFTPLSDRTQHPAYYSIALEYRHEMTFNFPAAGQTNNSNFALQIWKGDVNKPAGTDAMNIANVEVQFGIHNSGLELDTTHGTDLSADVALTDGEQLVLRFEHDGHIRLLRPSTGYGILATSIRKFLGENCFYIHLSGDANAADGLTTAPSLVQRGDFWKLVAFDPARAASGYDTQDWRDGTLTQHVIYQAVRPLSLGQKITGIKLPQQAQNVFYGVGFGGWTGASSLDLNANDDFTDEIGPSGGGLAFNWQTSERFDTVSNADLNTSNSNYNSGTGRWEPGTVTGGINIEFRYITSTKKVEVWDADQNEKILTSSNVMDASGRDINFVIGSVQNDLDDTLVEYNIENN